MDWRAATCAKSIYGPSAVPSLRFIIDEETQSSTSLFSFCHGPILSGIIGGVVRTLPLNGGNIKTRSGGA